MRPRYLLELSDDERSHLADLIDQYKSAIIELQRELSAGSQRSVIIEYRNRVRRARADFDARGLDTVPKP